MVVVVVVVIAVVAVVVVVGGGGVGVVVGGGVVGVVVGVVGVVVDASRPSENLEPFNRTSKRQLPLQEAVAQAAQLSRS